MSVFLFFWTWGASLRCVFFTLSRLSLKNNICCAAQVVQRPQVAQVHNDLPSPAIPQPINQRENHPTSNQKFAAFAVKTNRDRGKVLLPKYCRSHGFALPSHPAMEAVLLLRFNTLGNSYSQSLQRKTFQSHGAREMPWNFGQIQDLLPGNPATYISTT